VIFRFWGLTPKLSPQFPDAMGKFVAVAELVAMRYYATLCVQQFGR